MCSQSDDSILCFLLVPTLHLKAQDQVLVRHHALISLHRLHLYIRSRDSFEISVPDSDVFYLEQNNIPGICVKTFDEPMTSWTPIKIFRSRVADNNSSDVDIPIDDCLSYLQCYLCSFQVN